MTDEQTLNEKTLDEALGQIDTRGEKVARAIEHLSRDQVVEYFEDAQSRLEKRLGKRLNLPVRRAPQATKS